MTIQQLNEQINLLTEQLRQEKPQAYKMLSENPVTIPNQEHPDLSEQMLKDYVATLKALLSK